MVPKELLNSNKAAKYLGMKQYWVQTRRVSEGIPHYEINGRYYYSPAELDAWLQDHHKQGNSASKQKYGHGSKNASDNKFRFKEAS